MKRLALLASALLIMAMLAACAGGPASPASSGGDTTTQTDSGGSEQAASAREVLIGYTASQTGKYNVESTRQVNGLNQWMKEVNDAGGIKLADGTVVTFASKSYDDESNGDRVQELYTKLATTDGADFLISPYSSGLTSTASPIAEQYEKVMITTGAADDANYTQGYTGIYQVYTPASKYLTGAVDMLKAKAPDVKKLAVVHENDKFSTGVADAVKAYAESLGYEIVLFEGYDSATTDFAPFINKIEQSAPDAILGGGHFQDGSTFARQLAEKGVDVPYMALLVAPPEPTFADLGDAAVGVVGPSQWEPLAKFTEAAASSAGLTWVGPTGDTFVSDYQAAYNDEPSYHAAGGYVAGMMLGEAIKQAGSLDSAAVKAALDSMDLLTFYGHLKFDTSAEAHGLQVGHDMVFVQWQKDGDGNLVKQVVWPAEGATADLITR
ncbi:MAG: amino acid ABC transporter substrate-binding protein [Anaerolineae bacterium]|nr:amino acid ABC transporter substrate-binding protein [Anaerolineae bacterium]MCB9131958.1 amino acid ABC transporter substrate-binding protein [Anaerolineales bacterium]MCB0246055.1 amino acid ABC transporter substrate-binding protein [Anaerolineae bacterium]MCB0248140.1 amino acid ABC transporter substrate-binding protein [Anaerolineae bacterium]MCB9142004.1 amino acid ABC transporter substrate-binding protein [Anaerolineales bacterium]